MMLVPMSMHVAAQVNQAHASGTIRHLTDICTVRVRVPRRLAGRPAGGTHVQHVTALCCLRWVTLVIYWHVLIPAVHN